MPRAGPSNGQVGLEVTHDNGVRWEGELQGMDFLTGPQVDKVDLARLALIAEPRK
jgi:hypothetical protein